MPVQPDQRLSHYRLIEKIGEGGMGVVWKAEDTVLGRTVAIKVLPADLSRDETRREMFLKEARLASSVGSAHVVQVHEFGREGDLDYIVMEFIEGNPLNKLIQGRPLPPEKVVELGLQIAKALSRAHHKSLLHRDLKPANVLVTPEGDVKVVDFGLATLFDSGDRGFASEATTRSALETAAGSGQSGARLTGTIPYMSPEQVRCEELDARSDIFSLGTILYEMTTGHRPFTGPSNTEILQAILQARPATPHQVVPKLPVELDRLIQKALARRKSNRYQTMDDLAVDLKRLARELELGSSPSYDDLKAQAAAVCDPKTIMVWPLDVHGQGEGGDFVGRCFAESVAIGLCLSPDIQVVPAMDTDDLSKLSNTQKVESAREMGAGSVILGSLVRGDAHQALHVTFVDTSANRLRWGGKKRESRLDLEELADWVSREVTQRLGLSRQTLYETLQQLMRHSQLAQTPCGSRAIGAYRRSEYDEALLASQELVGLYSNEVDAALIHAASALNRYRMARSAASRKLLNDALGIVKRVDPNHPYLDMTDAWFEQEGGRPDRGAQLYSRVLERDDLTPEFRALTKRNRSHVWLLLGRLSSAKDDLHASLASNPLDAASYYYLSEVLLREGMIEEALERAQQAVALDASDHLNYTAVGDCYAKLNRWTDALSWFQRSAARRRTQTNLANCAIAFKQLGRDREALSSVDEAATLPATWPSTLNLACYHVLAGDRHEALRCLRRSLDLGLASGDMLTEPSLQPLHGDDEYEAIAAAVKKRLGGE